MSNHVNTLTFVGIAAAQMNFEGAKVDSDREVIRNFKKEEQEKPSPFNTHLLLALHPGNNITPSMNCVKERNCFNSLSIKILQKDSKMQYNLSSKRLRTLQT
ncbi:hypothetical protein LguiB_018148 [Lonicera macranthoides]